MEALEPIGNERLFDAGPWSHTTMTALVLQACGERAADVIVGVTQGVLTLRFNFFSTASSSKDLMAPRDHFLTLG